MQNVDDLQKYTLGTAKILYRNSDPEAAQDLAQDAMLHICRAHGRGNIRSVAVNRTYAAKVVRRLFLNKKRDESRRITAVPIEEVSGFRFDHLLPDPSALSPERATVAKLFYASVMEHIAKLPRMSRDSLLLFAGGMKYEEIAARLSIGVGAVKKRIYVARQRLVMVFGEAVTA